MSESSWFLGGIMFSIILWVIRPVPPMVQFSSGACTIGK